MGSGRTRLGVRPGMRGVGTAVAATLILLAGCSSSVDLESSDAPKNTIRQVDDAALDEENLAGGSSAARDMQRVIDRLVASNDPCAILTQKDVKGFQIDPSSLASSAVLRVLANGVIDVYDHLIKIIPDPAIAPALRTQRDTFVQVLDIVERYSSNPTSRDGTAQIQTLTQGPEFVKAGGAVTAWTYQNCS